MQLEVFVGSRQTRIIHATAKIYNVSQKKLLHYFIFAITLSNKALFEQFLARA